MKRLLLCCMTTLLLVGASTAAEKQLKLTKDNIDKIIKELTIDEKIHLVIGTRYSDNSEAAGEVGHTRKIVPGAAGTTYPVDRLGIPSIVLADGPAGLRIDSIRQGEKRTYYCTGFPVGTHLAATWNADIIYKVGEAMGNEVKEYGVDVLLAPGVNIMRNPLCGRNFEYYSEDPLLTGKTAAAMINGVESNGVGTSIKHFAANNQEINRLDNDSRVSLRALREIYLRNFEIAIKEAQPWTVMTSYNYLNGRYTSEDKGLIETILRKEWGFEGMVMTDWAAGRNPCGQIESGNDMIQPGRWSDYLALTEGIRTGKLSEEALDKCVKRVLELVVRSPRFNGYKYSNNPDLKAHAALTREVASEGFVLLKNDSNTLPLNGAQKVALFGSTSYKFIAGGRGSGDVRKAYVMDLRSGLLANGFSLSKKLDEAYMDHMKKEYERLAPRRALRRWYIYDLLPREMEYVYHYIDDAVADAETMIITIGRNSAEAFDRHVERDFNLNSYELGMIHYLSDKCHKVGKKVVVVLNVCGPVEVASWRDKVDAILTCWMPGQEGGNSVADVLLGRVSPTGHLPMTFPMKYSDVPAQNFPINVPETGRNLSRVFDCNHTRLYYLPNIDYTNYVEDIYVGYRHYATNNVEVAYPFGYGLTYTTFDLSNMKVTEKKGNYTITCTVKNTGSFPAKQVVQLYSSELNPEVDRPAIELRAYQKTPLLQPNEECVVTLNISQEDLMTYNEKAAAWKLTKGDYELRLGFDSQTFPASQRITITKEQLKPVSTVLLPESGEIFIK